MLSLSHIGGGALCGFLHLSRPRFSFPQKFISAPCVFSVGPGSALPLSEGRGRISHQRRAERRKRSQDDFLLRNWPLEDYMEAVVECDFSYGGPDEE